MDNQSARWISQVAAADWDTTPTAVKRLIETLTAIASLAEHENHLVQFLDATPIGIAIHDQTGRIIYLNQLGHDLVGVESPLELSPEEFSTAFQIYRAGTQALYPPQELPSIRALAGETAWADDLQVYRGSRVLSLEVKATPIFDPQGSVVYAVATFQDISDRKRQQLEQQIIDNTRLAEAQRYQQVVQTQRDFILRSAPDMTITFANDALCAALGQSLEQLVGQSWEPFVPADAIAELQRKIAALCPEQPTFENINRDYRDGQQIGWTQWQNLGIFDDRHLQEIQSVGRDVTALQQQIQREQSLNEVLQAIHKSLELETIFATATAATARLFAGVDSFVVQYFPHQGVWRHVAEHRCDPNAPSQTGLEIADADNPFAEQLKRHQIVQVTSTTAVADNVNRQVAEVLPGAWLLVPLVLGETLWGSFTLVGDPQDWQAEQIGLVQAIAQQLEVAIQQAHLYQQVQAELVERERIAAELRASEGRYRLLAENINDLVCLHDLDGNYLYISPSCEALLGYTAREMSEHDPYFFFHPEDREYIRRKSHLPTLAGKSVPITYRTRHKGGHYIWFETLTKPILDAAGNVVRIQTTSRDVSDRIQAQNQLKHDALYDQLTQLPNRALLTERLELAIQHAQRQASFQFAVLVLDLDRFKVINDSLGHLAGDHLLIAVAQQLQSVLRSTDIAARLGGDEFVILLEAIEDEQAPVHIAERIFAALRSPLMVEEREMYITASIGIVLSDARYTTAADLIRDADIAMYRAKQSGKARFAMFDTDMHAAALTRLHLEHGLRQAISQDQLVLHYQPTVNLATQKLVGFEALIRWQHPTAGLKAPGEFIPIAEETGLITQLDAWALRTACQQLAVWQQDFPDWGELKMSVNLAAQDLRQQQLPAQVEQVLADTGIAPHCLALEITESMLIDDIEAAITLLHQLKQLGVQISIDDFGTGYSSLGYLHRLPIDTLKVDRSFVMHMETAAKHHQIVATMAALSQQLNLEAIAEGIETPGQLDGLRQLGYCFGQGYLFSKALPPSKIDALLRSPAMPAWY
jgi:diguanylate cyclase (GGDEF)-like protein/PAS domain S-box-containing protein